MTRHILAIDDQPDVLKAYAAVLMPSQKPDALLQDFFAEDTPNNAAHDQDDAWEVCAALSGERGLAMAAERLAAGEPFPMAFVDMRMPGMDGVGTICKLWQQDPRMEIVVCTAYSDYDLQELRATLGNSSRFLVLRKPFDPIEVQQLARSLSDKWELARQAELQAQSDKLEMLGRICGGVAHDFNNILSAVMGSADLALMIGAGEVEEHLQLILSAATQGQAMTQRLLAYARQQAPKREPVELDAIIQELRPMLTHIVGLNIFLDINCQTSKYRVLMDPSHAARIILNLVVNARDALCQSGTIRIHTRVAGEGVELVVADNGPGMTEDIRKQLFQKSVTTKGQKGSGMGLQIVAAGVAEAQGRIEVASELGIGSTFTVWLPSCSTPPSQTIALPVQALGQLQDVRIAVIEPNMLLRHTICAMLEIQGALCSDAASLSEIDPGRSQDVLILDLEACEHSEVLLKQLEHAPQRPRAVVLLANMYIEACDWAVLLNKPFDQRALLEAITSARGPRTDALRSIAAY